MKFKRYPAFGTMQQSLVSFSISISVQVGLGLALTLIRIRSQEEGTGIILSSISPEDSANEVQVLEFTALPQTQQSDVPEQVVNEVAERRLKTFWTFV